jgi:mannosyltransferase
MSSKTEAPAPPYWTAVVLATVAVAIVLRFIALGHGLWYDEIVTLVLSVRQPLAAIVTESTNLNTHPLYSVLAHAAIALFGESGWALRLPAAVCGVASVMMVYLLAAQHLSRIEAWAAAMVLATSYHHVWFSQNARGYTLMGFLALLATTSLIRAGQTGSRAAYVTYAVACAAGVYTHLTMAFVVAGHAAVIIGGHLAGWRTAREQPLKPLLMAWTGAVLISVALYAPLLPGLVANMGREDQAQAAGVATAGRALSDALLSLLAGTGVPAALLGAAFAAVGALSMLLRWPLLLGLLAMPAVVTSVALVGMGQPLRPRFFFFLSAAAALFVGRGIGAVATWLAAWRREAVSGPLTSRLVVALVAVVVALSAMALPTAYSVPKQDFEGAVAMLDAAEAGGATIAMAGPACLPLQIYYSKNDWPCLTTADEWRRLRDAPSRALVVHTLSDYIIDPVLRDDVRNHCGTITRFPGTLGGGDLIVCGNR